MSISLSHPVGNANVRAIAKGLVKANLLQTFYTTIASFPGSVLDKVSSFPGMAEFKRRSFDASLMPFTYTWPLMELGRMLGNKTGISKLIEREVGLFSFDSVYKNFDKHVAHQLTKPVNKGLKAVYAYEDGALNIFTKAKKLGLHCIYDLPIAYWETARNLLQEEAERLPEWAVTLGGGINDSQQKLERKTREMELADMIVTPGNFVADSVPGFAKNKKIVISPFGSPATNINWNNAPDKRSATTNQRPLRVLFAGSMGQRKGLADLFAAMQWIAKDDIELVVMGSLSAPLDFYKNQFPGFIYEPGRPHAEVLKLMRSCDVFCLPSIVEGRALVMQEAMSQGLPLIITPNTGGADLIIEEETGFLVPIRSPQRIAEKIQWFLDHREQIPQMSEKSKAHASTYTWENYSQQVASAIKALINN